MTPTLLTLSITQEGPGWYMARVTHGDHAEVTDPTYHSSIEAAISAHGGPPAFEGLRGFHVWYGGVCAGTIPIGEMESRSAELGALLPNLSKSLL